MHCYRLTKEGFQTENERYSKKSKTSGKETRITTTHESGPQVSYKLHLIVEDKHQLILSVNICFFIRTL